jgi:hypothetical protein
MYKLVLIFVVLLIVFSACSDNISPKAEFGKIQIRIIDVKDNLPVAGALVRTSPPSHSAIINDYGEYVMEDLYPGEYNVIVEKLGYISNSVMVKVIAGKTTKADLYFYDDSFHNTLPQKPLLVSPGNNSISSKLEINLSWTCIDDDNDLLTYTVYFDEINPPIKVIAFDTLDNFLEINKLKNETKYYWYVVAKDKYGIGQRSNINSFKIDTNKVIDDSKLILNLPFNNDVNDYSTNQMTTECTAPAYTTDRKSNANGAFSFNKNLVKVKNNPNLNLDAQYSISVWIKPNSVFGIDMIDGIAQILGRMGSTGVNTSSYGLCINSNSNITFQTYANATGTASAIFTGQIMLNEWNHIVINYINQSISLFINSKHINTVSLALHQTSNYDLYIGGRQTSNRYFSGALDDLKIFNNVLTQQEINSLFSE